MTSRTNKSVCPCDIEKAKLLRSDSNSSSYTRNNFSQPLHESNVSVQTQKRCYIWVSGKMPPALSRTATSVPLMNLASPNDTESFMTLAGHDALTQGPWAHTQSSAGMIFAKRLPDVSSVHYRPVMVDTLYTSGIRSLSVGSSSICVATQSGELLCWGDGPAIATASELIASPTSHTTCGRGICQTKHYLSATSDTNAKGEYCGTCTHSERPLFLPVRGVNEPVISVSGSRHHLFAVTESGAVLEWRLQMDMSVQEASFTEAADESGDEGVLYYPSSDEETPNFREGMEGTNGEDEGIVTDYGNQRASSRLRSRSMQTLIHSTGQHGISSGDLLRSRRSKYSSDFQDGTAFDENADAHSTGNVSNYEYEEDYYEDNYEDHFFDEDMNYEEDEMFDQEDFRDEIEDDEEHLIEDSVGRRDVGNEAYNNLNSVSGPMKGAVLLDGDYQSSPTSSLSSVDAIASSYSRQDDDNFSDGETDKKSESGEKAKILENNPASQSPSFNPTSSEKSTTRISSTSSSTTRPRHVKVRTWTLCPVDPSTPLPTDARKHQVHSRYERNASGVTIKSRKGHVDDSFSFSPSHRSPIEASSPSSPSSLPSGGLSQSLFSAGLVPSSPNDAATETLPSTVSTPVISHSRAQVSSRTKNSVPEVILGPGRQSEWLYKGVGMRSLRSTPSLFGDDASALEAALALEAGAEAEMESFTDKLLGRKVSVATEAAEILSRLDEGSKSFPTFSTSPHASSKPKYIQRALVRRLPLPRRVPELNGQHVTRVSCSPGHSVALTSTGLLLSWGRRSHGRLGHGGGVKDTSVQAVPRYLDTSSLGGRRATAIATGWAHTLFVTDAGLVYSLGCGLAGRLGNGGVFDHHLPTLVRGFAGAPVVAVAAGAAHSLALDANGQVWAWGANQYSQLGLGHTMSSMRPVPVPVVRGSSMEARTHAEAQERIRERAKAKLAAIEMARATATSSAIAATEIGIGIDGTDVNLSSALSTTSSASTSSLLSIQPQPRIVPRSAEALSKPGEEYNTASAVGALGANADDESWTRLTQNSTERAELEKMAAENFVGSKDPVFITKIACGPFHCAALSDTGEVFVWGWNRFGQLGIGHGREHENDNGMSGASADEPVNSPTGTTGRGGNHGNHGNSSNTISPSSRTSLGVSGGTPRAVIAAASAAAAANATALTSPSPFNVTSSASSGLNSNSVSNLSDHSVASDFKASLLFADSAAEAKRGETGRARTTTSGYGSISTATNSGVVPMNTGSSTSFSSPTSSLDPQTRRRTLFPDSTILGGSGTGVSSSISDVSSQGSARLSLKGALALDSTPEASIVGDTVVTSSERLGLAIPSSSTSFGTDFSPTPKPLDGAISETPLASSASSVAGFESFMTPNSISSMIPYPTIDTDAYSQALAHMLPQEDVYPVPVLVPGFRDKEVVAIACGPSYTTFVTRDLYTIRESHFGSSSTTETGDILETTSCTPVLKPCPGTVKGKRPTQLASVIMGHAIRMQKRLPKLSHRTNALFDVLMDALLPAGESISLLSQVDEEALLDARRRLEAEEAEEEKREMEGKQQLTDKDKSIGVGIGVGETKENNVDGIAPSMGLTPLISPSPSAAELAVQTRESRRVRRRARRLARMLPSSADSFYGMLFLRHFYRFYRTEEATRKARGAIRSGMKAKALEWARSDQRRRLLASRTASTQAEHDMRMFSPSTPVTVPTTTSPTRTISAEILSGEERERVLLAGTDAPLPAFELFNSPSGAASSFNSDFDSVSSSDTGSDSDSDYSDEELRKHDKRMSQFLGGTRDSNWQSARGMFERSAQTLTDCGNSVVVDGRLYHPTRSGPNWAPGKSKKVISTSTGEGSKITDDSDTILKPYSLPAKFTLRSGLSRGMGEYGEEIPHSTTSSPASTSISSSSSSLFTSRAQENARGSLDNAEGGVYLPERYERVLGDPIPFSEPSYNSSLSPIGGKEGDNGILRRIASGTSSPTSTTLEVSPVGSGQLSNPLSSPSRPSTFSSFTRQRQNPMGIGMTKSGRNTASGLGIGFTSPQSSVPSLAAGASGLGSSALGGLCPSDVQAMGARYREKLIRDARDRQRVQQQDAVREIASDKAHKERMRQMLQREQKLQQSERVWRKNVLCTPEFMLRKATREQAQLLALSEGVPPRLRREVWLQAIGNRLGITPELFSKVQARAVIARKSYNAVRARALQGDVSADLRAAALSAANLVSENGDNREGEENNKDNAEVGPDGELIDKSYSFKDIDVDLTRTFPALAFYQEGSPMKYQMRAVLDAFCFYKPQMGYVQGMSYLAGKLLLYMGEYDAFVCLANMVEGPFFRALYGMETSSIDERYALFESLLIESAPDLARYFEELDIFMHGKTLYFIEWCMTLFCKRLEMDVIGRIWDGVFLCGESIVYRTSVAILICLKPLLMGQPFEVVYKTLTRSALNLTEKQLADALGNVRWTVHHQRSLNSILQNDETRLEEKNNKRNVGGNSSSRQ